jgi:predicted permease
LAAGFILRKKEIFSQEGKQNLTELILDLVLPASIIRSFEQQKSPEMLFQFSEIFIVGLAVVSSCVLLSRIIFRNIPDARKKILQYGFFCPNAGLFGSSILNELFGATALSYGAVYLIPLRIVMWSFGIALFTSEKDHKLMIRRTVTHPCVIATVFGLGLMLFGLSLPAEADNALEFLGSSCTALSMLVIGMALADADFRHILEPQVILITILRLAVIPGATYLVCRLCSVNPLVTGISVLLTAMPVGSTTVMLAMKYQSAPAFATKCVVLSTLCSMLSTPLWSMLLLR